MVNITEMENILTVQMKNVMDRRNFVRFFIRSFFFIALPVVLVVALLGYVTIWITNSNARKNICTSQEQSVSRIMDGMNVIFSEADAQSLNYSISPYIMVKLKSLLENGYIDKAHLDIAYMMEPFIDSNVNGKSFLHSEYIYLNNEHGNFFASGVGLANELNYNDTDWIETVLQKDENVIQWLEPRTISSYLKSSYDTEVLAMYKRLYGSVYSKPIGILVLNIRKEYMEQFLKSYVTYEKQSIVLLDNNGRILCQAGEPLPEGYFEGKVIRDKERDNYFINSQENKEFEVTCLSLVPSQNVKMMAADMIRIVWFFIAISLILGTLLAYFVNRRNVSNVNRVVRIFNLAERGEPLPEIREEVNDEYSYIMQNVVKNYVEKNALQIQLAERKHKLDNMYYLFLQSQLSPHFLFNTLKNIFWKTMKLAGGPNDTSKMIDLFTNLLYYALVWPDKFVRISEEIKMTASYMEIQQMRFEYHFQIIWDYDPCLEQYDTIKFVLQPLVENSISHGFGQGEVMGKLVIRIEEEGGNLIFSVSDNGSGITEEKLIDVKESLHKDSIPTNGIGLYNLNKRLVLTYGEGSALSIESEPGIRTKVTFFIPIEKGEKK